MTTRHLVAFLVAGFIVFSCSIPPLVGNTRTISSTAISSTTNPANPQAAPVATLTPVSMPSAPPSPVGTPMKSGDFDQSIVSGGLTRTYILHIPPGYDGTKALPLVFVLHGRGGTGKSMIGTGMSARADQANFIVVYPDGTGDPSGWNSGLNEDSRITADDVGFFKALIDKFGKELGVDPARVYAAGFSGGAIMTYRLGAELTDQFAAIAVVEGAMANKQPDGSWLTIPNPSGPMAVIIFHGQKDTHIPYNGGQGNGAGKLFAAPVTDAVNSWVKDDGCTDTPTTTTVGGGNVTRQDYVGCIAGSEVAFYAIANGEHAWPTPQHNGISATNLIWEFFSKHFK
jgi:polyhydroxybutyrate depolymerase